MSPRTLRRRTTKRVARKNTARRVIQRVTSWNLGMQVGIAVSAMMVLALLGVVDKNVFSAAFGSAEKAAPIVSIDIGLEHSAPTDVDMLIARKGPLAHVEVRNTSNAPLQISLPEGWEQSEVSGGSLWLVTKQDPEFGFVRWTIPAAMGMTMRTEKAPDIMTFHSPSGQTASIRVQSIDLQTEVKNERTLLFQNVAQVKLWGVEE